MNKLKIVSGVAALAACGLLATGCQLRVHDGYGGAVVTEPAGADISVDTAPPAPMDDTVVGVAPGPDYVWVGGDWGWNNHRWSWHRGSWQRPPHAGAHWSGGRYDASHHTYHKGRWQ
jgi:hypothetical protein